MDESSATGESDPIKKRVPQNFEDTKVKFFNNFDIFYLAINK